MESWKRRLSLVSNRLEGRESSHPNAAILSNVRSNDIVGVEEFSVSECNQKSSPSFEPGRHLVDQVVVITGGGSGIGACAAILFAHHGAKLVLCDINEKSAQKTADIVQKSVGEGKCLVVAGDVTDPNYSKRVVSETIEKFGEIHHLILNAGFTWDAVVHKMQKKQWDAMLEVHCTAPFLMIQAAAPYMRDAAKKELGYRGWATSRSILTVSSVSGVHGNAGQANYATGKAGVIGLTRAVAKEWGHLNIRANALVLGHFKTRLTQEKEKGAAISFQGETIKLGIPQGDAVSDIMKQMIALKRIGSPEEAAGAMLLITGPYASYITGQAIEVTGGGWM